MKFKWFNKRSCKKSEFKENSQDQLKLENQLRKDKAWLFKEPVEIIIDKHNPPILVYQMGKVGSTSVAFTLRESDLPNPVYHVHQLSNKGIDWNIEKNKQRLEDTRKNSDLDDYTRVYTHFYLKYLIRQLDNNKRLRKKIDENLNVVPWKIITLVRDPIMREISDFFFSFHKHPELVDKKEHLLNEASLKVLKNQLTQRFKNPRNWILEWFDKEMKEVFGVDVYQFPFDHEKGYTFIHSNNISILIFKLKKLDQSFSDAIFEFLNKKDLKLIKRNVAEQKFYYETHQYVLRNITLDNDFCSRIYNSRYAKHFYTDSELKNFMLKWSGCQPNVNEEHGAGR